MDEFTEKVIITLLDKGVLAIVALIIGYWIHRKLETFKTDQQRILALEKDKAVLENDLNRLRQTTRIQFKEKQLSSFYWPIFLRFQKDSAMWRAIPQLSGAPTSLPDKLGREIERSFLLTNHEEVVSIIESNVYLAEADDDLLADLVAYIKHVAIYKSLREANNYDLNPIDLGEPFPKNLLSRVENRLRKLQADYEKLIEHKTTS